jgi:hypothetical protein
MTATRKLDLAWLVLVLLSVAGAALGGGGHGLGVTVMIAAVMAVKLRLVCEHFLELGSATPRIRQLMYAFCYGMAALVVLTSVWGGTLARLTGALI